MKARGEIIEDLVILLRGFFATPVISSLGRLGVLQQMRSGKEFKVDDFNQVNNHKLLTDTFSYFLRLGLIERSKNGAQTFLTTDLGFEVFRRANSFYVPHSYFDYLYKYHEMIQSPDGTVVPEVERLENVIGSGITHQRYFPPAISFLKRHAGFTTLVDIGCGDGHFLMSLIEKMPNMKLIGIDMSEVSTEATKANISSKYPNVNLVTYCCDGSDINEWSRVVIENANPNAVAFAMWFFIQEISKNNPDLIVDLLNRIREIFPNAPIVIGEMVKQPEQILVENNHRSLIPEYLFFHDMSNQGVLTWDNYQRILAETGYQIGLEKLYDEVVGVDGQIVPSTFIWCLTPERKMQ